MQNELISQIRWRNIDWDKDLLALLAIERRSFAHPWSPEDFEYLRARAGSDGLVADLGARPLGYFLYERKPAHLFVAHSAVDTEFRRTGIGKMGFTALKESIAGGLPLSLHVRPSNTGARRLYEGLGFVYIDSIAHHYGDGEAALLMQCNGDPRGSRMTSARMASPGRPRLSGKPTQTLLPVLNSGARRQAITARPGQRKDSTSSSTDSTAGRTD